MTVASQGSPKSFVLVHGAWHGGWCWRRVVELLRLAGHDSMIIDPAGLAKVLLQLLK